MKDIKLKDLRNIISRINPISICFYHDFSYENYRFLKDVPEKYDDFFVCGIGTKSPESEEEEIMTQNGTLGIIEIILLNEK